MAVAPSVSESSGLLLTEDEGTQMLTHPTTQLNISKTLDPSHTPQ